MKSLAQQTSILIICRFITYSILFVTPVFLVRILTIEDYGKYREFMLYATLLCNLSGFSVNASIMYFIPKYGDNKKYISNSIIIMIFVTVVDVFFLILFKDIINKNTSFEFFVVLILYICIFLNFNFCEQYWIATKKTHYVLYYNSIKMTFRSVVVIGCALYYHSIIFIIYSLVFVELVRFIFVFIYALKQKIINFKIDFFSIKEQSSYFIPVGLSNFIFYFNKELSKFFILYTLGVEYLAYYSIGAYQIPVIGIIRSSIGDIIFPEVCNRSNNDKKKGLELWKKTNIIYVALILPFFVIFYYYSEFFIKFLFTEKYLNAVIIFKIYMFLMIKECFEMGIPLRSVNKNIYYMYGSVLAVITNIILLILFHKTSDYVLPAVAYVFSDVVMTLYMGKKVLETYAIKIKNLFYWEKIVKIVYLSLIPIPLLYLEKIFNLNNLVEFILFSSLYMFSYTLLLVKSKIYELTFIYMKIKRNIIIIYNNQKLKIY
ncbi:MAG: oligosaccharide flippase family protein [Bacilli bacterium]